MFLFNRKKGKRRSLRLAENEFKAACSRNPNTESTPIIIDAEEDMQNVITISPENQQNSEDLKTPTEQHKRKYQKTNAKKGKKGKYFK